MTNTNTKGKVMDEYVNTAEAARILHIKPGTFSNYRSANKYGLGDIPKHLGRRFKRSDILEVLERATIKA